MKAITISQPYASLIASGEKWIENRRWNTEYRGDLAIHAGKGTQYLCHPELNLYPIGCVIAVVRLAACVRLETIKLHAHSSDLGSIISGTSKSWSEAWDHEHAEGPWCWILEDVRTIEHIPVRGQQRLWNFNFPSVPHAASFSQRSDQW